MNEQGDQKLVNGEASEKVNTSIEVEGCKNVDTQVVDAVYQANFGAHKPGMKTSEVVDYYTKWAPKYEAEMQPGIYNGPKYGAKALADHFPAEQREKVRILDVAAGTGLCGMALAEQGFKNVDALEPSVGMVEQCKLKEVYSEYIVDTIGDHETAIKTGTYDAMVITGGMGEGHIPVSALDEMARIVKKDGLVCIVMREEYLKTVGAYVDQLEPRMERLAQEGKWRPVSRTRVPNYSFGKMGLIYLFQVL